jgi:hypothetical protein
MYIYFVRLCVVYNACVYVVLGIFN